MPLYSKLIKASLPITLTFLASTQQAYAACARNDIDYYLSKGFTTEQITAICTSPRTNTSSGQNNNQTTPAESATSNMPSDSQSMDQTVISKSGSKTDELLLIEAIKGRNVVLTDNSLQYTLKNCVEYRDEDQYGFAPKACPQVKFVVALKGLEVLKSGKRYLFYGDNEIQVKGSITWEVIEGLASFKAEDQKLILKKLESGDQTTIPIRDDIPLDSVVQLLKKLAS